ncbi:MAG: hypothetical protein K1W17_07675 [Oscillospiraceae bacterium]
MKAGKKLFGAIGTAAFMCAIFAYTADSSAITASAAVKKGVAVNETNFPDPAFRKYVSDNIDKDSDLLLSADEINSVRSISVSGMKISDLGGIEYFTGLTSLICMDNSLTELDVSSNKELTALSASGNMLSEIDLSRNTKLENLDLGMTAKDGTTYGNSLTELDLSRNKNLKNLSCVSNSLKKLDLSGCPKLEVVKCSNNRLTEINTVGCGNLRQLECYSNSLKKLDLKGNPNLNGLYCSDNKLTSLDLRSNTELKTLFCRYNYITRKSKLMLSDKSALNACDYNPQYYSGYRSYVTDVNMQYDTVITNLPTDVFGSGTGITGTPSEETVKKAGGIEFVCKQSEYSFKVSGAPGLSVDKNNRLTAEKAGEYTFTLTVKKGNADGTDFVKKLTVSAVDEEDHTKHEYQWKCDRENGSGHYKQCFCGDRTASEPHEYGSRIYQINDRSGKLYNYRACKVCRYADKLGESTVLKNAGTGITIATLDGTIASHLKLAADPVNPSEIKTNGAVRAYDIYFTDGSSRVKPGCKFNVTIPLPKGVDGTKAEVFRKKSDGSLRDMNADYDSGDSSISFTASVSGVYVITSGTKETASGDKDTEQKFDVNDLIVLREALSEGETDIRDGLTDMNGDGKIDNKDLILLKNSLSNS